MDDKGWPVAYHGLCKNSSFAIPKVIKGGLRPGYNNYYTNEVPAIYCSPNFDFVLR